MSYSPPALSREEFVEVQASLANSASIDSGWHDTETWSKYQLMYNASGVLDLTIESRPESSGSADVSTLTSYTGTFYLADLVPRQRYMRFIVTNNTGGAVTAAVLSLKSIFGGVEGASVFPVEIAPSQFSPAMLTQAVLIGKDTGGTNYQNITINQAGAMLTGDFDQEVARGTQSGYTLWNKFGYNPDVDSAAEETVWAYGGAFSRMTSADTLDVYSSSASDDDGSTGVNSVVIYGIDANWEEQTELVTMDGTTHVTTSNTWLGVNCVEIFLAGSGGTNAGNITVETNTGANVQAYMPAGEGVTQQCIFFVPADSMFVAEWLWFNCLKLSGGGSPRVRIKMNVYSDVNQATQEVFRADIDTSVQNAIAIDPKLPFPIGEKSMLILSVDSDTNNTEVSARFSGTVISDA